MPSAEPRPLILSPGERLGGYTIDAVLGIGGMAVVYQATQQSLRRTVALKVLDRRLSETDGFRERFQREGALVASLDHPNIVPMYDSGEDDGRLYLAMRWIDGDTLADRMRRPGLSADETAAILEQLGGALDVAHAAGVLHRDVKPQNVLLAGDRPYLADFGVAKSADAATATGTGGFLGSVHYASPEQIRGGRLDGRTDVYSLAAVAFECITGRAPFTSPSEVGVMHAHLEEPPPQLPGKLGAGGKELSKVIASGLAKAPADRPASAGDFATALAAAVRRLGRDERTRRPAFPMPAEPKPAAAAGANAPGARDETVDLAQAAAAGGPAQEPTIDLTAADAGAGAGATVHDRRSVLLPRPDVAPDPGPARRRRALIAGLLVVGIGAPVLALLLRGGDAAPGRASFSAASLTAPMGWSATPSSVSAGSAAGATLGGASTGAAKALRGPVTGGSATLTVAALRHNASLVPPKATGAPHRVLVDGGIGYQWTLDPAADAGAGQVLVVPGKDGGGAVLGCGWSPAQAAGRAACEAAWASAELDADGVSASDATAADAAIATALEPIRASAAALPARGDARRETARKRAVTYRSVGSRLERAAPWNGDAQTAAAAAKDLADAYDRLARAAINRDRTADARWRARVRAADARLHTAVGLLRAQTASSDPAGSSS